MQKTKKIPMRKCTGCNESKEKKELVRVVKTPEGNLILDKTGRANGRGAYICNNMNCLESAIKRKGLERSLGIEIPKEVSEELKKLMVSED